jgi:hypothetical protein
MNFGKLFDVGASVAMELDVFDTSIFFGSDDDGVQAFNSFVLISHPFKLTEKKGYHEDFFKYFVASNGAIALDGLLVQECLSGTETSVREDERRTRMSSITNKHQE